MNINLTDLRVSDFVLVKRTVNETHVGRIDAIHSDIKGGMPGIDYTTYADQKKWWCYLDQVIEILK